MKFKKNGKFFKSLRFRILIILIILGIVPSVIVTEMGIANYEDRAIANRVQSMENICDIMCDLLIKENYLNDSSSQTVNSKLELLSNIYGGRILIVDRDFRIIKDTYGVDEGKTLVSQKVVNCFKGEDAYRYDSDSQKLILAVPVKSPVVNQVQGAMMIMASSSEVTSTIRELEQKGILIIGIIVVLAIFLGYILSTVLVKPFARVTKAIEDLTDGYQNEEISVPDYTETALITDAFNKMLSRMKTLDESRQEFVSNVSHELKTPMTSMKVLADSLVGQQGVPEELYQEFLSDITEEIDRENKIITDLLSLVKMDKKAADMNITNMNINEVVANRALELMGHQKGEYQYCHPNNHVNMSQSTNDAYPTSFKLAFIFMNEELVADLKLLIQAFRAKGEEFKEVLKMGRTQLQDAVPMTMGQEFEAFAANLEEEVDRLNQMAKLFLEVNMGATAIGTGINSEPEYSAKCIKNLRIISGEEFVLASNLIEATPDAGSSVMYSSALIRLAVKLSKICNDLRLLSSGPRCGLNEINLPPMQPGSSIMPGKVNPVIPEVVNQICYRIIGNDLTVTFAAEAGQLQLNVMEPVMVHAIFSSIKMLQKGMDRLRILCVEGITANTQHCREMVLNSIGIVTALNPTLGYENSSRIAKRALKENRSVYDLVLEEGLLTKDELDQLLKPESMIKPHKFYKKK